MKPYCSNTALAVPLRRTARYAAASGFALTVAATVTAKPEAAAYLAFLRGTTAKAVFEQYGFAFLVRPTS